LLSYLALFGALFMFPFYLQAAGHLSAAAAGARLLCLPLALGVTAPAAGILAERWGARPLTVGGMLLAAAALVAIGLHPSSAGVLLLELVAMGVGVGAFTSPNNATIMRSVRREQSGMASGILNMTRGVGTAIGVALTGVIFGVAAGVSSAQAHSPASATKGLIAAAFFLAAIAVAAAVFSALRGSGEVTRAPAFLDRA
jgi:MFS family permease